MREKRSWKLAPSESNTAFGDTKANKSRPEIGNYPFEDRGTVPLFGAERRKGGKTMRLTGFEAIEYAEKEGLRLNKHPDSISGPRIGLSIAEAEAIASEDPGLIWLDVPDEQYYGEQRNFEPER
jgi:hypothetical protein